MKISLRGLGLSLKGHPGESLTPPEGFAFVVDGNGNYVVDGDGAYIVTEI